MICSSSCQLPNACYINCEDVNAKMKTSTAIKKRKRKTFLFKNHIWLFYFWERKKDMGMQMEYAAEYVASQTGMNCNNKPVYTP